jgi:hypothetical protein
MDSRTAFVAMKFERDVWNDKKYVVISDVLEEAGFKPIRADGIRSSEASASEIAEYLRNAALVVVDISGYSANVSYELGFCHGAGRDPSSLILICQEDQAIPFNYAHFRRHSYADLRHLRALLRYRLDLSIPLTVDQTGYVFAFTWGQEHMYGHHVAEAIVQSIKKVGFTGRCEFYAADRYWIIPNLYVVGLGVKFKSRKMKATLSWWDRLRKAVDEELKEKGVDISLELDLSELTMMRGIRADQLPVGVAEFEDGVAQRLLSPEFADSWFSGVIQEEIEGFEEEH